MEVNERRPHSGPLDILLKGVGQVMFCDNRITGALFLAGIALGSWATDQTAMLGCAIWGVLVSTFAGYWLGVDKESRTNGLSGYNGCLVGAALGATFQVTPTMLVMLTLASAFSTVLLMATNKVMKTWGVAALTFPFVVATWTGLACLDVGEAVTRSQAPAAAQVGVGWETSADFWLNSLFNGIAQVFLIGNFGTGVFFLVGLAFASRWAAGLAVVGSLVGLLVALGLGARTGQVFAGGFGFNPVLTAIALGCIFNTPSWRAFVLSVLGAVATTFVHITLTEFIQAHYGGGFPVYTFPFVLVTWVFLLARPDVADQAPTEENSQPSAVG